jgi:AraC family ethanolamine operon transcriptional activator
MPAAGRESAVQIPQRVEAIFDDFDSMAASALEWDQEYEQIGHGKFRGHMSQLVFERLQLGRVRWSPGVLQRGTTPKGSWGFGLPLKAKGTLHVRRRPVQPGELITATSHDDVGFTATGPTDLMVVVLPSETINRWMQNRRRVEGLDPDLPPRHLSVSRAELAVRARWLAVLLDELGGRTDLTANGLGRIEAEISDIILDIIPSAEIIESFHNRARIARKVLELLHDRREDPPSVTEMCGLVGARERTLHLSCVEAFGRPPA